MSASDNPQLTSNELLGEPIEIHFGGLTLPSKVERVDDERLLVRRPRLQGSPVRLPEGCRVRLFAWHRADRWQLLAEVRRGDSLAGGPLRLRSRGDWRRHLARRSPRIDRRLAVELRLPGPEGGVHVLGITRDISAHGFAMLLDPREAPEPGAAVIVRLSLAVADRRLELEARCVRQRALEGRLRGRVEAGFEFLSPNEQRLPIFYADQ